MPTPIYVFNKYYILYHNIISLAISQNRYKSKETYYENHHIIPKSFGGSNEPDNLVLLTAKEHYICHHLLTKFTILKFKRRMVNGFHMMHSSSNNQKRFFNCRTYEFNKLLRKKEMSGKNHPMFGKTGKNSPLYGKKHTEETKNKMSNSAMGQNNSRFSGYYVTPWGKFESSSDAETNILSHGTIIVYCKNPNKKINKLMLSHNKYLKSLKESPLGKTCRDLGFYFIPINGY